MDPFCMGFLLCTIPIGVEEPLHQPNLSLETNGTYVQYTTYIPGTRYRTLAAQPTCHTNTMRRDGGLTSLDGVRLTPPEEAPCNVVLDG
jgi:hypothetical protein